MDKLIRAICELAEPTYCNSVHYPSTIWPHALAVAEHAKAFAQRLRASLFVAEAAGLLHDIGAAKFGKENHHVTGAELATGILLQAGCPARQIGAVAGAIYSHRGSQKIPLRGRASVCVAAADAKDHFDNVSELWLVADESWGIVELARLEFLLNKLGNDWKKIHPQIKEMLNGTYEGARQTLVAIANGQIRPVQRPSVRMFGNGRPS